jgi:hypothetical protein
MWIPLHVPSNPFYREARGLLHSEIALESKEYSKCEHVHERLLHLVICETYFTYLQTCHQFTLPTRTFDASHLTEFSLDLRLFIHESYQSLWFPDRGSKVWAEVKSFNPVISEAYAAIVSRLCDILRNPRCPENKKQVWDFVVIRWLFRPRSRVANHIKIMKGKSFVDSFLNTFANSLKSRFLRSFEAERFLPNSPRICSLNVITNNILSNTRLEYTCLRIS